MMKSVSRALVALLTLLLFSPSWASAQSNTLPTFGHVVIVVGENTAYGTSYNSGNMPYLTNLANTYGLGVNYYSDTHPSIGNYFTLTTGQILSNNDTEKPSSFKVSADNIALEVQNVGKTWRDYVEDLPSVSGCGGLNSGSYYVRHDPLEYMTTINTETSNFQCFSQFETDLKNNALPNLSWLVPNGCDDAHDCSIGTFDNWLKTEISPLLSSGYFKSGGDGLLIVVFDEDDGSGTPNCSTLTTGQGCGGKVELVVISPQSKSSYQSTGGDKANFNNSYEEENVLRTMAQGLGLNYSGLGSAATALPMSDFFNTTTSTGSVSFSPTSLSFGNVTVGTNATKVITLTNGTSSSVSVSGIGISPTTQGFTETNNCPSSLLAGTNCTISVTFAPTAVGSFSATLSATAGGTTLTAGLTGSGVSSTSSLTVSISPTSLNFGHVLEGTTTLPQDVTVTNTSTSSVTFGTVQATAPFVATNGCTTLAAGAQCTISVTFAPTSTGHFTGTLSISDNASGSPQVVSLVGWGAKH